MAGVLLNSGNLQQYTAIGDEGQPVYSVASQLREAVRLKVGPQAADCLAVPRVNDARSSVDWYSTRQGTVVPWSAATEQERADALRDLEQFHHQVQQAVTKLGGVSDREKRIVQNLLTKVFHFPGQDCVFLVDGRPVLTFWGFQTGTSTPAEDPFHTLRLVPVAIASPALAAAASTATPGRPWWIWLLLLLLLAALLFWLLRGCMQDPARVPNGPLHEQTGEQIIKDPAHKQEIVPTVKERGVIGGVQRWWQGVTGQVPEVPDSVDAAGNLIENGGVGLDPAQAQTPVAEVPETQASEGAATEPEGKDQLGEEPKATDPNAADPPEPVSPAKVPENSVPPGTDPASKGPANGAAGSDSATPLGTPMAIPPEALKSGSVQFLDGKWRAAGGLQDSQTGQPVRLQYQFDNGQANVTVERGGGVQCEGVAKSAIVGGKLQISEQGALAKCSDGSTFALPQITCTPDQAGRSQCAGQGQDGRSLPITIRKTP